MTFRRVRSVAQLVGFLVATYLWAVVFARPALPQGIPLGPALPTEACDAPAEYDQVPPRFFFLGSGAGAGVDGLYVCTAAGWAYTGPGAGSGEANTMSCLGGGLCLYDSKSGVDLRLASLAAADFDLSGSVASIDDTKWAKDADVAPIAGWTVSRCLHTNGSGTIVVASADCGTVTSVAASGPTSILTWSAAVTSSGTLTATAASTNANLVMAGPASGGPAAWAPRALVAADIPALPYVRAELSADTAGLACLGPTAIPWDSEPALTNNDSAGWHDNTTNETRITFDRSGLYLVTSAFSTANSTQFMAGRIRLNGTTDICQFGRDTSTTNTVRELSVPCLYYFAASDYVEAMVSCQSGTIVIRKTGSGASHFSAVRLGG